MNMTMTDHKTGDIRIVVRHDEDAESPRDWSNVGTMICWHPRYQLGDKHDYTDIRCWLASLVSDHATPDEVFQLVIELDEGGEWEADADAIPLIDAEDSDVLDFLIGLIERSEQTRDNYDRILGGVAEIIALPLYLYDHSGITMNTTGFSCGWDSGQVGYIVTTQANATHEYGALPDAPAERVKTICERLKGEVEIYDTFLRGNVYNYTIERAVVCETCQTTDWEHVDSCGGFYGDLEDNGMLDAVDKEHHEALRKAFDNPVY